MGDNTNAHVIEDSSCRLYSLSLDWPITLPIPSSQVSGKALEELKAWIWKNHAEEILQSLRLDAVVISNNNSSGKHNVHNTRNDLMKGVEEKEEETKGSHIHRHQHHTSPYRKRRGTADGPRVGILPNNRENLLDTIAHVQRQFFQSVAPRDVFGGLLEGLLDLMSSEYGFIGEVKYEDDGTMYLQTHAITNIAWNQATQQFYDDNFESGLKFYNLKSLFGTVMTTQRPVISNNPSLDARACGIPEGHPPLNHFLGLPFFHSGKLTGMVGISNKPGGYSEEDIDFLEPLTVTCSNLIQAYQQIQRNDYLINTLEESVKARTQELEIVNKNLEEANRQVRQNAVMQLQHFACMSHEIRTPLNCIIGMSSLLNDTMMTPVQKEAMKMIIASGDLLLAIVNDVLDYAKLETDHVEINVMSSDLQEMLQSILYSIEMTAKRKGQSIKTNFDPNLPVLLTTDIRKIQQILFNLLGNAVKFSKDNKTIELAVTYENGVSSIQPSRIEQQQQPQCDHVSSHDKSQQSVSASQCPFNKPTKRPREVHEPTMDEVTVVEQALAANPTFSHSGLFHRQRHNLRFVVTDYGKGINSSDFEAIFRPFHQTSGTQMNAAYGGTGLGLAITKKLVAALGGTISVDSVEGSWSKFTVELPCSDHPAPVKELSKKMSDATILIVGLPDDQVEYVMQTFNAFSIDVRLMEAVDDLSLTLSSKGPGALAIDRRIICLIRGDRLTAHWLELASEYRMRWNLKICVFSFGPHASEEANTATNNLHHIRSLEQMIPQSLIEMLHEQSSNAPSFTDGKLSKVHSNVWQQDLAHQDLRVLIAEDNKVNQKVLLRMLKRLGVKSVDVVGNGQDAVDKEESTAYDVILMDQQMPVMGGIQACRLILDRKERIHPVPYIFFVTAHVSTNFEKECKEAGSSGFLPKPFKFEDIEKCIRNVVTMVTERNAGWRLGTAAAC